MTTNPIQPAGTPGSQTTNERAPTKVSHDEDVRTARPVTEASAPTKARDNVSPEALRLLSSIEESVGKLRTALGASSHQTSHAGSDRPNVDPSARTGAHATSAANPASTARDSDRSRSTPGRS